MSFIQSFSKISLHQEPIHSRIPSLDRHKPSALARTFWKIEWIITHTRTNRRRVRISPSWKIFSTPHLRQSPPDKETASRVLLSSVGKRKRASHTRKGAKSRRLAFHKPARQLFPLRARTRFQKSPDREDSPSLSRLLSLPARARLFSSSSLEVPPSLTASTFHPPSGLRLLCARVYTLSSVPVGRRRSVSVGKRASMVRRWVGCARVCVWEEISWMGLIARDCSLSCCGMRDGGICL